MKPSGSQQRTGRSAFGPPSVLLLGLLLCAAADAQAPELELPAAVREALASNLDLVARRQDLEAARQEIGLARSKLLPQVGAGARAHTTRPRRTWWPRD